MPKQDKQEAMSSLADGAQTVPAPHTDLRATAAGLSLAALHGHSVAMHLAIPGNDRILIGVAEYVIDPDIGPALRVFVEDSAELEILLAESLFRGRIRADDRHQCDFLIDWAPAAEAQKPASSNAPRASTAG